MIPIFNANCGLKNRGTKVSECYTKLGRPDGFINVDSTWSLPASGDLTQEVILAEIKKGNFVPFNKAREFATANEDDVYKTYAGGDKLLVRKGLIEMDFTYSNGRAWHGAAAANDHSGTKSCILVFKSGHLLFDSNADGTELKGLRMSHQTTAPFKDNDGQNPGETMIKIQLTDTQAYNQNVVVVSEEDLGLDFSDAFAGALDSYIEVVGNPAASETSIVVTVSPFANRSSKIAGIEEFKVSGQAVSAVVYDAATSQYTLTVDALTAGTKTISLGAEGEFAAEVTERLYSGSRTITVS